MRTSVLAAGGIALALALSACGGDDADTDNALTGGENSSNSSGTFNDISQLVANAKEQTTKTQSASFSMTMDMAGMSVEASGDAVYAGADTAMNMQMDMAGMQMEAIFADQTMYMKLPENMGGDPSKPWVKTQGDAASGQDMSQMTERSDPTKMLEQLEESGGKITNTEETDLDGQPVTHYTVELDLSKATGMLGDPSVAESIPEGTLVPMELYMNADNLPVKIEMDMSSATEAAGLPGEAKMVMTYSDWGKQVDIQAPPAEQVKEMEMPAGMP